MAKLVYMPFPEIQIPRFKKGQSLDEQVASVVPRGKIVKDGTPFTIDLRSVQETMRLERERVKKVGLLLARELYMVNEFLYNGGWQIKHYESDWSLFVEYSHLCYPKFRVKAYTPGRLILRYDPDGGIIQNPSLLAHGYYWPHELTDCSKEESWLSYREGLNNTRKDAVYYDGTPRLLAQGRAPEAEWFITCNPVKEKDYHR